MKRTENNEALVRMVKAQCRRSAKISAEAEKIRREMDHNIRWAEKILSMEESQRTMKENSLLEYLSEFLAAERRKLDYAENHMQCMIDIIDRIETEALRFPAYANLVHGYTYEKIEKTLTSGTTLMASRLSREIADAVMSWEKETDPERIREFLDTEALMDLP